MPSSFPVILGNGVHVARGGPTLLPVFLLMICTVNSLEAAETRSISGTLVFENTPLSCDNCVVVLLANGVRTIATVPADVAGHFTFNNVPPGAYTIHVELDGFEDVNQQVDAYDDG